jgi:hypothetical protein
MRRIAKRTDTRTDTAGLRLRTEHSGNVRSCRVRRRCSHTLELSGHTGKGDRGDPRRRIVFVAVWIALLGGVLIAQSPVPAASIPILVKIGNREIEVIRSGEGSPTLALESGAGEGAERWLPLVPNWQG